MVLSRTSTAPTLRRRQVERVDTSPAICKKYSSQDGRLILLPRRVHSTRVPGRGQGVCIRPVAALVTARINVAVGDRGRSPLRFGFVICRRRGGCSNPPAWLHPRAPKCRAGTLI